MKIKIYVAALPAYTYGKIVRKWFTLPMEEEIILDEVLLPGNEECIIISLTKKRDGYGIPSERN